MNALKYSIFGNSNNASFTVSTVFIHSHLITNSSSFTSISRFPVHFQKFSRFLYSI